MTRVFPLPRSVIALRNYSRTQFLHDATAGVTVGLVALPLAMAFAMASGVPPEAGLYCAIVAGFLISALGGSNTQIGGPTGAFVVVVSGILAKYGMDGLMMCTLLAGVMLVLLGATGMGTVIQYIPRPVVIGFTNGIAVLIASTQIKDFFGLRVENLPAEFLHRMQMIASHWHTWTCPPLLSQQRRLRRSSWCGESTIAFPLPCSPWLRRRRLRSHSGCRSKPFRRVSERSRADCPGSAFLRSDPT